MKSDSNISIIVRLYGDNDNDDIIIDDDVGGYTGNNKTFMFNIEYKCFNKS